MLAGATRWPYGGTAHKPEDECLTSPSETEVFIDDDEIFSSGDATGMVITFTAEFIEKLGTYMELARTKGFDMQEQWVDHQLNRTVLCFGDAKIQTTACSAKSLMAVLPETISIIETAEIADSSVARGRHRPACRDRNHQPTAPRAEEER